MSSLYSYIAYPNAIRPTAAITSLWTSGDELTGSFEGVVLSEVPATALFGLAVFCFAVDFLAVAFFGVLVFFAFVGFLVAFLVPLPFYFLEILVGVVQGLVFMMLALVFFTMATISHAHGDEHH